MIDEFYKTIDARLVLIERGRKGPNVHGWPKLETRWDDVFMEEWNDRYNKCGWILDDHVLVLDVDVHDEDGYASLQQLSDDCGADLWNLAGQVVETPSGGAHLYFWKSPDIKYPKTSAKYPGLDFLSVGSQVIAAGSQHDFHAGEYQFSRCGEFLAPLPMSVLECLTEREKPAEVVLVRQGESTAESPVDEINSNPRAIELLKDELCLKGYSFRQKQDHWEFIRPGKQENGDPGFAISGTLGRQNSHGRYYLRNFSTSDPHFQDTSYSLFEALRILRGEEAGETIEYSRERGLTKNSDEASATKTLLECLKLGPLFGRGAARRLLELGIEFPDREEWIEVIREDDLKKKAKEEEHRSSDDHLDAEAIEEKYGTFTLDELVESTGGLRRPYIIEGLLRTGEVCNLISSPKVGKSWLVYNLCVSLACDQPFLGFNPSRALSILIVDNELHREELAWRVQQVAKALELNPGANLKITMLRGGELSLHGVQKKLDSLQDEQFDLIVLDAFYRVLPRGMSENDNAAMTQIYNQLDAMAGEYGCGIICVHHSTKGSQGAKSVTDVGAGAGTISRAADTHMVIREHADDGLWVIEAVTRSGESPGPRTVSLDWPLWVEHTDIEVELKTDTTSKKSKDELNDNQQRCLDLINHHGAIKQFELCNDIALNKMAVSRAVRVLLERELIVSDEGVGRNGKMLYSLEYLKENPDAMEA